jgi:hypothetical protein
MVENSLLDAGMSTRVIVTTLRGLLEIAYGRQ